MDKDMFHKIALALLAYHNLKNGLEIPAIVNGEEAVEIIKKETMSNVFSKTLCTGENDDLIGMADVLGIPKTEYLEFCKEIYDQMKNEVKYLHQPNLPEAMEKLFSHGWDTPAQKL